jgi:hypothetical protein
MKIFNSIVYNVIGKNNSLAIEVYLLLKTDTKY